MQRVDHPDPAAANEQALHDLENGATGLTLVLQRLGQRQRLRTRRLARDARSRARRRLSRCRRRHRLQRQRRDARRREELRRAGEEARRSSPTTVELRGSLNPLGHIAATGTAVRPWTRARALLRGRSCANSRTHGFRGPFAVADGRVIHNAGGSEAQELAVRARERRHLSARARSRRRRARCGAADDLFPPCGGCRPVSLHREIPRDPQAVGARRAGLRACACGRLRRGRDRMAHDDAARSLREHPALHDRGVRGRSRRRGRDHGAAVHRRARPAGRASRAASRAIRS